jgi:hypothetical protein
MLKKTVIILSWLVFFLNISPVLAQTVPTPTKNVDPLNDPCLACRINEENNGKSPDDARNACSKYCVPTPTPLLNIEVDPALKNGEGKVVGGKDGKLMIRDPNGGLQFGYNQFDMGIQGISCGVPDSSINKCCTTPKIGDFKADFGNFAFDAPTTTIRFGTGIMMNVVGAALSSIFYIPQKLGFFGGTELSDEQRACVPEAAPYPNLQDSSCICKRKDLLQGLDSIKALCQNVNSAKEQDSCMKCILGSGDVKEAGIWTGMGCIYADTATFIQRTVLGYGISISGGVALLCIMYSAFLLQVSRGNPERIKKAQEMLTSCIVGLLLIIFSVFILQFIGVNILRIPGFVR